MHGDRGMDEVLLGVRAAADVEGLPALHAAGHRLDGVDLVDAVALASMVLLGLRAVIAPASVLRLARVVTARLGPVRAGGVLPLADLAGAGVPLALGSGVGGTGPVGRGACRCAAPGRRAADLGSGGLPGAHPRRMATGRSGRVGSGRDPCGCTGTPGFLARGGARRAGARGPTGGVEHRSPSGHAAAACTRSGPACPQLPENPARRHRDLRRTRVTAWWWARRHAGRHAAYSENSRQSSAPHVTCADGADLRRRALDWAGGASSFALSRCPHPCPRWVCD